LKSSKVSVGPGVPEEGGNESIYNRLDLCSEGLKPALNSANCHNSPSHPNSFDQGKLMGKQRATEAGVSSPCQVKGALHPRPHGLPAAPLRPPLASWSPAQNCSRLPAHFPASVNYKTLQKAVSAFPGFYFFSNQKRKWSDTIPDLRFFNI
jgi:hypothetical protein